MKIELIDLTVRDLVDGYSDDGEGGVVGYGGKLDILPPFQREAVITSILPGGWLGRGLLDWHAYPLGRKTARPAKTTAKCSAANATTRKPPRRNQ